MSKYINLDDPDVTYSHNAGNHEVYIVGSEAERIDIVRCGECKYYSLTFECMKDECGIEEPPTWFCADGERRADDE